MANVQVFLGEALRRYYLASQSVIACEQSLALPIQLLHVLRHDIKRISRIWCQGLCSESLDRYFTSSQYDSNIRT